ncbi:phytanoyl-CoA dioxygenase [Methylomonas sp. Kb3]|uniref:phytanoyl-CoA dioxygenase family protein n=1 Tax=Methylomonas sp. Kb3 TaxID=1611544 RepID=UPI000C340DAF|nr:phytanoyl-CoA dioxygenase family protein [Methylomonas sp. Kb3]PKD41835.1 phytanoyl-CoA dioxygenase [Methylomonas sp. Kb3]
MSNHYSRGRSNLPEPLSVSNAERFCEQGFIAVNDYFDTNLLLRVSEEWQAFCASATPSELPVDRPAAVFWRHVQGDVKRIRPLAEFPALSEIALGHAATQIARQLAQVSQGEMELRLFETIVFSKPPLEGGMLSWHQDNPFFPFDPQNQIALWIPLDDVDPENGGLEYAIGSHKAGVSAPFDLHSGANLGDGQICLTPADFADDKFDTFAVSLRVGGVAVHDGRTWHRSFPNTSTTRQRRAISLRYLVGPTRYSPRQGTAASMNAQINLAAGALIDCSAFPLV